jgi:hypothetical protein
MRLSPFFFFLLLQLIIVFYDELDYKYLGYMHGNKSLLEAKKLLV